MFSASKIDLKKKSQIESYEKDSPACIVLLLQR